MLCCHASLWPAARSGGRVGSRCPDAGPWAPHPAPACRTRRSPGGSARQGRGPRPGPVVGPVLPGPGAARRGHLALPGSQGWSLPAASAPPSTPGGSGSDWPLSGSLGTASLPATSAAPMPPPPGRAGNGQREGGAERSGERRKETAVNASSPEGTPQGAAHSPKDGEGRSVPRNPGKGRPVAGGRARPQGASAMRVLTWTRPAATTPLSCCCPCPGPASLGLSAFEPATPPQLGCPSAPCSRPRPAPSGPPPGR